MLLEVLIPVLYLNPFWLFLCLKGFLQCFIQLSLLQIYTTLSFFRNVLILYLESTRLWYVLNFKRCSYQIDFLRKPTPSLQNRPNWFKKKKRKCIVLYFIVSVLFPCMFFVNFMLSRRHVKLVLQYNLVKKEGCSFILLRVKPQHINTMSSDKFNHYSLLFCNLKSLRDEVTGGHLLEGAFEIGWRLIAL